MPDIPRAERAIIINPDCAAGKHANCDGGWDADRDEPCPCPCACHQEAA